MAALRTFPAIVMGLNILDSTDEETFFDSVVEKWKCQRMCSPPGGSNSSGITIRTRAGSTRTVAELSTVSLSALKPIQQSGGKIVHAWAVEGDLDPATIVSNTFEIEWPPRSGRLQSFPEVDRGEWFDLDLARAKLNPAQVGFLDDLSDRAS